MHLRSAPRISDQGEVKRQMNSGAVIGNGALQRKVGFANDDAIFVLIDNLSYAANDGCAVGMITGVDRQIPKIRTGGRIPVGINGIVSKLSVFHQVSDRVHSETADVTVEPESQHLQHGLLNVRIAPV